MSRNNKKNKAIALSYDKNKDLAPKVVATGKGFIADKILELADNYDIAIYKDPTLADALVQLDIGQKIPPELYSAVAKVLAFLYNLDMTNKEIT